MVSRARVAVVDDEPLLLRAWQGLLKDQYDVSVFDDALEARASLRTGAGSDVVLLDVRMPGCDGMTLLDELRDQTEPPEVIMLTGAGTVENAVAAMRRGAFDFVCKPVEDFPEFLRKLEAAIEHKRLCDLNRSLSARLEALGPNKDLIGESAALEKVRVLIQRMAGSSTNVLIQGESGTGKELVARAIHRSGDRSQGPFIAFNCSAISESLLESELFGHERGAFTGATSSHVGLFEAANGGTLFLDEVGDMPLPTQARILRALQEREVRRVGSAQSRSVDIRILAATNVDLEASMRAGQFREDLYYRLSTFRISLPPLRERRGDIPVLAQHLLDAHTCRIGRERMQLSIGVLAALEAFHWPGNVRQLASAVEHAATLADHSVIELCHLPSYVTTSGLGSRARARNAIPVEVVLPPYQRARHDLLEGFDRCYLQDLLEATEGNISEAARRSGIDRANLRRMLKRYRLG